MTIKTCKDCRERKAYTEFSPNARMLGGVNNRCKPCAAAWNKDFRSKHPYRGRAQKFGITEEALQNLYNKQNSSCAGCGKHETSLKKRLHIDHCHTTGVVRGLLCNNCNIILGHSFDDPEILKALALYLRKKYGN